MGEEVNHGKPGERRPSAIEESDCETGGEPVGESWLHDADRIGNRHVDCAVRRPSVRLNVLSSELRETSLWKEFESWKS